MNWYKKAREFVNEDNFWSEDQVKIWQSVYFLADEVYDSTKKVIDVLREQTPFYNSILDIFEEYNGSMGNSLDVLSIATRLIQRAHNEEEVAIPDLVAAVNKLEFLIDAYKKKLNEINAKDNNLT